MKIAMNQHQRAHFKAAFTLTEILVTISIIGILAATVTIGLRSSRNKAKIAKAKSEMRLYGTAIQEFHSKKLYSSDKWPEATADDSGCSGTTPYRVPQQLMEGFWKDGQCSIYKYAYNSTSQEVSLQWPGIDGALNSNANFTATGANYNSFKKSDDVLLIINSSTTEADIVPDTGRNDLLSDLKDRVIYMTKNY